PRLLHAMEDFQHELQRLPVVAYSISPVNIMEGMRERFNELEPKWGVIPSTEREVAETQTARALHDSGTRARTRSRRTAHGESHARGHRVGTSPAFAKLHHERQVHRQGRRGRPSGCITCARWAVRITAHHEKLRGMPRNSRIDRTTSASF